MVNSTLFNSFSLFIRYALLTIPCNFYIGFNLLKTNDLSGFSLFIRVFFTGTSTDVKIYKLLKTNGLFWHSDVHYRILPQGFKRQSGLVLTPVGRRPTARINSHTLT